MRESLKVAARNFDQLARVARAILDRRLIGLAIAMHDAGEEA